MRGQNMMGNGGTAVPCPNGGTGMGPVSQGMMGKGGAGKGMAGMTIPNKAALCPNGVGQVALPKGVMGGGAGMGQAAGTCKAGLGGGTVKGVAIAGKKAVASGLAAKGTVSTGAVVASAAGKGAFLGAGLSLFPLLLLTGLVGLGLYKVTKL
ncbi:MAG: hypothetical protein HQL72_08425 [Magnetococcales bacterium]|nr:hypothetical protein [Magnetococcales bacterium]